jgi:hypothetical protein
MITLLFKNHFEPEVKYPIIFSLIGQPIIKLNPNQLIQRLLPRVRDFLFNKERHFTQAVLPDTIEYYLSLFPLIDTFPFTSELLDRHDINEELDYKPGLNQRVFRSFFSSMYGYKYGENYDTIDPILQKGIKERIENMKLGPGYDAMVDMIHRHQGEVMYVSE